MTTASDILKRIKDEDIKFVDLRFTDPKGKMQHLTMDIAIVDEDMFADGVMFDGSSIEGWRAINESDIVNIDGISVVIGLRILGFQIKERAACPDIFDILNNTYI
jgi:glutamine synthetase